jgi:hypothetical protein
MTRPDAKIISTHGNINVETNLIDVCTAMPMV